MSDAVPGRRLVLVLAVIVPMLVGACNTTSDPVITLRPAGTPGFPASPSVAPTAGSAAPGELEQTVPCEAASQQHTVPLIGDADGPPRGVGGEPPGEYDEGKPPPVPVDPAAIVLETPIDPDPEAVAGGVQLAPDEIGFSIANDQTILSRAPRPEPNVASDGTKVLLTWNWYAAASTDGGQTFRGLDPTDFPYAVGFCCDQLAHYIPERDLWIWILQSSKSVAGNAIRVAVARGNQDFEDEIEFSYWDWTPGHGGFFGQGAWLDRPKIAESNEHLFIAVNAYTQGEANLGALVIRMPLDQIAGGGDVQARCYGTRAYPVPVTVAADTMYLAAHGRTTSEIVLWRWPDAAAAPAVDFIEDRDANGTLVGYVGGGYACPRDGNAATDWCAGSSDSRPLTGWVANGRIGFAWNAAQAGAKPYPYVYSVFIDEQSLRVVDHWTLSNQTRAVQFPMFAPNARGDLGGVVLVGGGNGSQDRTQRQGYISCAAVVRDAASGETTSRYIPADESTRDPALYYENQKLPETGDYLGVWPNGGSDNTWSAGCMTYTEAGTRVHFVRFGLGRDLER
jgi:hypothetical protein